MEEEITGRNSADPSGMNRIAKLRKSDKEKEKRNNNDLKIAGSKLLSELRISGEDGLSHQVEIGMRNQTPQNRQAIFSSYSGRKPSSK